MSGDITAKVKVQKTACGEVLGMLVQWYCFGSNREHAVSLQNVMRLE